MKVLRITYADKMHERLLRAVAKTKAKVLDAREHKGRSQVLLQTDEDGAHYIVQMICDSISIAEVW